MKKLEQDLTLPVIGNTYKLFLGMGEYHKEIKIDAVYLGFRQNKTHQWFMTKNPEGHIFGIRDGENNLKIYNVRENYLKEFWLSDGEDGPEWPVGYPAREFKGKLKDNISARISEFLDKKSKERRAA